MEKRQILRVDVVGAGNARECGQERRRLALRCWEYNRVYSVLGGGVFIKAVFAGVVRSYRVLITCLLVAGSGTAVAGDPEAGRARYDDRCGRCHGVVTERTAGSGVSGFLMPVVMLPLGPNLSGIYGRKAGTIEGYRYSDAFAKAAPKLVWDEATLDRWIANSREMIPGTYMLVRIAASERADIIAYLKAFASK